MTSKHSDLIGMQKLLRSKEQELEKLSAVIDAYRIVIADLEHKNNKTSWRAPGPLSKQEEHQRTKQVLKLLRDKGQVEAKQLAKLWNMTIEGAAKWMRQRSRTAPWKTGSHGRIFVWK